MVGEIQLQVGLNKLQMRSIKKIIISVFIVMFISFFAYNLWLWEKGKDEFINLSYNGIVNEIKKTEDIRGLPMVKIGNQWRYINVFESKIALYIQVGDSIVKNSGNDIIIVLRKNEKNEWEESIFK